MGDEDKKVEEMHKRLDKLQDEIDEARTEAENVDPQRPKDNDTYVGTWNKPSGPGDSTAPPG